MLYGSLKGDFLLRSHRSLWHGSRSSQDDANNFFKTPSNRVALKRWIVHFHVNISQEYERNIVPRADENNIGIATDYNAIVFLHQ